MSAPAPLVFVAIPALIFVAIGAAIVVWPRALLNLQIRIHEWQIGWMKGQSAVVLMRVLGAFLLLAGLAFFLFAAMASK